MTSALTKEKKDIIMLSQGEALTYVKRRLESILRSSPFIIREYTSHLAQSQGKFIRTRALIACAVNANGEVTEDSLKAATTIELLHLATLVHDDVIDDAKLRRNIATLNSIYGRKTAVICGDYLFCLCLEEARKIGLHNEDRESEFDIVKSMKKLCFGELLQHLSNGDLDISPLKYYKIISGKTAALFETTFFAGAFFNDEPKEYRKKYAKIGHYLGMIFQIIDDCIDYESDITQAAKPVKSDFEQGVITLPLIYAINDDEDFKTQIKNGEVNSEGICKKVSDKKGVQYAKKVAKKCYDKAMKLINVLEINEEKKQGLVLMFDAAMNRNS